MDNPIGPRYEVHGRWRLGTPPCLGLASGLSIPKLSHLGTRCLAHLSENKWCQLWAAQCRCNVAAIAQFGNGVIIEETLWSLGTWSLLARYVAALPRIEFGNFPVPRGEADEGDPRLISASENTEQGLLANVVPLPRRWSSLPTSALVRNKAPVFLA